MAKHFHWMSDETAQKLRSEGFWKIIFYRGFFIFGLGGVAFITLTGLIRNGMQTFGTVWWREGTIGFLASGVLFGGFAWLILSISSRLRDIVCWLLLIAVVGFLGWTLY